MAGNIEIKARVANPARTKALAEKLGDTPVEVLEQEDGPGKVPGRKTT